MLDIKNALGTSIPEELRESVSKTFSEVQKAYLRRDWKAVGVDAGHFVEATKLRNIIEYKNLTNFRKILKRLHDAKLIEYSPAVCKISPTGFASAKRLSEKFAL